MCAIILLFLGKGWVSGAVEQTAAQDVSIDSSALPLIQVRALTRTYCPSHRASTCSYLPLSNLTTVLYRYLVLNKFLSCPKIPVPQNGLGHRCWRVIGTNLLFVFRIVFILSGDQSSLRDKSGFAS
jgi:hypothetical protein